MISFTACHIVGAAFLGIGLPLGLSFPYIFSSVLQLQLQLTKGSAIFTEWNESPIPIYMDIYMWNWTNAEDFVKDPTITPEFNEVGPFVFKIETKRANVHWNENNTVTYSPNRTYLFQPNQSVDLETPITNLSPVPSVLAYYGRLWSSPFFLALINKELNLRESLYQTESAENWLFNGVTDSFFDLIVPLRDVADLPIPYDKFAWFYGRNQSASAEGVFTVNTGVGNLDNLGSVTLWKGMNRTSAYDGHCGEVGGTTGELLPPMKEQPETLSVFSSDICSQLTLEWENETEVHGVSGWKFIGSYMTFDDGSIYPENECFCNGDCVPAGIRNISACKFGAPAFVSFPHFYLADESISGRVKGMQPNRNLHEFNLKVEPTTGIPLFVQAQLQINLLMSPSTSLDLYRGLPEIYIPMLWFREHAEITPELANMLSWVLLLQIIAPVVLYSLALIGVLLLGSGYIHSFVSTQKYSFKNR